MLPLNAFGINEEQGSCLKSIGNENVFISSCFFFVLLHKFIGNLIKIVSPDCVCVCKYFSNLPQNMKSARSNTY